jgi:hypothetical protein
MRVLHALRSGEAAVIGAHRELSAPSHAHDYKLIAADLREVGLQSHAVCVRGCASSSVSMRAGVGV